MLLSDDKGSAALFCVTVYFGARGEACADAMRAALRDAPWLDSLEAALAAALAAPLPAVAPPLEVSNVAGVVVALLDESAPKLAGAPATAADERLQTVASLSMPQPGQRQVSRRASLRAFLSRHHVAHPRPSRESASDAGVPMSPRISTRRMDWVAVTVPSAAEEEEAGTQEAMLEPTPPREPPSEGEQPAQPAEPLTWEVSVPSRPPPPAPEEEGAFGAQQAPPRGEELMQLVTPEDEGKDD